MESPIRVTPLRRCSGRRLGTCAVMLVLAVACAARGRERERPQARTPPNVLFIAVDDLRPEGEAFGPSPVKTPNITALAGRGTTFVRAYAQQALCSPSRTSLLTGLRPDTTRIYDLQTHFRATVPAVVTLPEHFKRHGYYAQAFGKIYHEGLDDPQSWSVPHWMPSVEWYQAYGKPETLEKLRRQRDILQAQGKPLGPFPIERGPAGVALKLSTTPFAVRGHASKCNRSRFGERIARDWRQPRWCSFGPHEDGGNRLARRVRGAGDDCGCDR